MHRRVRSAGDCAADVFGPKMLRRRLEVREARELRKKFPAEDAEAKTFMRGASSLVDVWRVAERNLRVCGSLSSVFSPRLDDGWLGLSREEAIAMLCRELRAGGASSGDEDLRCLVGQIEYSGSVDSHVLARVRSDTTGPEAAHRFDGFAKHFPPNPRGRQTYADDVLVQVLA